MKVLPPESTELPRMRSYKQVAEKATMGTSDGSPEGEHCATYLQTERTTPGPLAQRLEFPLVQQHRHTCLAPARSALSVDAPLFAGNNSKTLLDRRPSSGREHTDR